MSRVLALLLVLFVAVAVGDPTYFSYEKSDAVDNKLTAKVTADVEKDTIQTYFDKWMATVSALNCTTNPYTAEVTCMRRVRLFRETKPFSGKPRSWPFRANVSWITTSPKSTYCTVALVNKGLLIFETRDSGETAVRHVGLTDSGLEGDGIPKDVATLTCSYAGDVVAYVQPDGDTIAVVRCGCIRVFRRSTTIGTWSQTLPDFSYSSFPQEVSVAPDTGSMVVYSGWYYMAELNSTNQWNYVTLQSSSDLYILVNSTTLIRSQPYYNQPAASYAGQIMFYTRTGVGYAWNQEPYLTLQIDPGRVDTKDKRLLALAWLGGNRLYARTGSRTLHIDMSKTPIYAVAFDSGVFDYMTSTFGSPVFGRSFNEPIMVELTKGVVSYPLGASSATVGAFYFVVVALPIIAVVLCCCCCCFISNRKKHSYSSYSSSTTSTYRTSTPSYSYSSPGADQRLPPELSKAMENVSTGLLTAIKGLATDKLSTNDAITIMAYALIGALKRCAGASNRQETEAKFELLIAYTVAILRKILDDDDLCKKTAALVLTRLKEIINQTQAQNLDQSLDLIRNVVRSVWASIMAGKTTVDEGVELVAVALLGSMSGDITTRAAAEAHIQGFSKWMMVIADECAPSVSSDMKQQVINQIWQKVAEKL